MTPDSLIQRIKIDEVPDLIEEGVISGGMIPKLKHVSKQLKMVLNLAISLTDVKTFSLLEIFTKWYRNYDL